jgi:PTS system mannose-specific IIA component
LKRVNIASGHDQSGKKQKAKGEQEGKMIGGIIVSHGKLAEELLNALTIILGEAPNIEAISIGWYDDLEDSKKKINQSLKKVDQKNGVVIFTDMFGGTPSNLSFSFLKDNQVEIITGVNLPMLIKFVSLQRSNSLQDVAKKVLEQGRKNIHLASALLSSKH